MLKTKLFSLSRHFTPLTLSFIAITITLLVSFLAPDMALAACDLGGGQGCGGG